MLAGCFLGVEHRAAVGDFVNPAAGGDQGNLADLIGIVVEDLLRQTGGFREVASRSAVFDGDGLFGLSHASLLVVMSAPALVEICRHGPFLAEPG